MSAEEDQGVTGAAGMPDNGPAVQNPETPPAQTTIGLSPEQMAKIPQRRPEEQKKGQQQGGRKGAAGALGSIIIFLVIAIVVAYLIAPIITKTTTISTTSTSTIPMVTTLGCNTVSAPGPYHIVNNVKYSNETGTCLLVNASNVKVTCESNVQIVGSGPFGNQPPFSYGIEVRGANNVSIIGCGINNFSYGIMAVGATNLTVQGDNVSNNYVSDIYLNASTGSRITHNYISRAESREGAIYIASGSSDTNVTNNTIQFNTFLGIIVNSTHNAFLNNRINGTPVSFYCGLSSSFPTSSSAEGNVCYNDTGCGFLACMGNNLPANISQITLGSSISGCGSINAPGTYSLDSNIDMAHFVNVGSLTGARTAIPCIRINANNVKLDCRDFTISHATVGVQFEHGTGLTLSGCNFTNSTIGLYFTNAGAAHVQNVTFSGNTKAFLLSNSSTTFVSGIKARNNTFGMYIANSQDIEVDNFNVSHNAYGFYLNNSMGDVFNIGTAFNNSQIDFYSSPNYVGASYGTMESTTCGITNAQWATCNVHENATLGNSRITYCQSINKQGTYVVPSRLLGSADCISIDSSNVKLNCGRNIIEPINPTMGYAISVENDTNVTVQNCNIYGYGAALKVFNVSELNLTGLRIINEKNGIELTKVTRSSISNNTVNVSSSAGISLSDVNYSTVMDNSVFYSSIAGASGIVLNNSMYNIVMNNTGHSDYLGINITGASTNNTVLYNSFENSGSSDYACAPKDSGLFAEKGRIDYGFTKGSCSWMAVVPKSSSELSCSAGLTSDSYILTNDWLYGYNSTCYSIYANGSTINCNGHMVIATNGGTFASFSNNVGSRIENCYLIGFITPIIVRNSSLTIINNTIILNSTSIFHRGAFAINMTGAHNSYVRYNNISSVSNGIELGGSTATLVQYNNVDAAGTAYEIYNSIGVSADYNTASASSPVGMDLANATSGTFQGNDFGKLLCSNASTGADSNVDQGGNKCSTNSGCAWISASSASC